VNDWNEAPTSEEIDSAMKALSDLRYMRKHKGEWTSTSKGRSVLQGAPLPPARPDEPDEARYASEGEVDSGRRRRVSEMVLSTLKEAKSDQRFRFDPRINPRGEIDDADLLTWIRNKEHLSRSLCDVALGDLLLEHRIAIAVTPSMRLISARKSSLRSADGEDRRSIDRTGACPQVVLDLLAECESSVEDRIRHIPSGELRAMEIKHHLLMPFPSYGLPRVRLETLIKELFPTLMVEVHGPRPLGFGGPPAVKRAVRECIVAHGEAEIGNHFGSRPVPEIGTYAESIISLLDERRTQIAAWLLQKTTFRDSALLNPFWGPVFRVVPTSERRARAPNTPRGRLVKATLAAIPWQICGIGPALATPLFAATPHQPASLSLSEAKKTSHSQPSKPSPS
jgi:hypothetical protein